MKTLIQVLDIKDPDTSILFLRNPLQYKLGTMYGGTVHSSMFLRAFLRTKQPPGLPSFIATTYMSLIKKIPRGLGKKSTPWLSSRGAAS